MSENTDWIELNLPYWHSDNESFEGKKLNIPGNLIRIAEGEFLIGHINPVKGICDDCVQFKNEEIVLAYKVVWRPDV